MAWITIYGAEALERNFEAVKRLLSSAKYDSYVVATSLDTEALSERLGVECYMIDAMTLRTINRSKVGVMVLDNGVVVEKRNIRDID